MAEHSIEAGLTPAAQLHLVFAEIDEQLISALSLGDLVRWIANARYFVDTMRWKIEHSPELQQWATDEEFSSEIADWQKAETEGLEYLHMEIASRLRAACKATSEARQ